MYWPCGVPHMYNNGPRKSTSVSPERTTDELGEDEAVAEIENAQNQELGKSIPTAIVDLQVSRSDALFVTITGEKLALWSVRPTVVLASICRPPTSLGSYGENLKVYLRPDASIVAVWTAKGYLMLFAVESKSEARVYQQLPNYSQARRQSLVRHFGVDHAVGLREVILRYRKAIKIDAGVNAVLALDSVLVAATAKPAAVQCIRWESDPSRSQTTTQLVNKTSWMTSKAPVVLMRHDRAMNLSVWLSQYGQAYAVQTSKPPVSRADSQDSLAYATASISSNHSMFDGYCFHSPEKGEPKAVQAAINARFSLIAIASEDARICCYAAKDYAGNIPLSHRLQAAGSPLTTGAVTSLTWSPDGYCLFAGFERGWATWSVFGKEGASSFTSNNAHAESNGEKWLQGIATANWTGGGSEILLTCPLDTRIWKLSMSRSAAVGCFSCANLVRALLQAPSELSIYQGHEMPDLISISNEASLWHHAPYPASYLYHQAPIRASVASQDGRYVAIAGRRGLAHYSLQSGRWKTFSDGSIENSFAVRGGMCWFNYLLAAATEHAGGYDLRLYSRDADLGRNPLCSEAFAMPIVFIGPSGEDSLLVYTYENILYHYVLNTTVHTAQLVQVGQIAFHGIVRAPSRVRSASWIVPDRQLRSGDPSRDVEFASVLFLVDDKLVLLQPSRTADNALKYDMRVIAQRVEYYILMRDQIYFNFSSPVDESVPPTPSPGGVLSTQHTRAQHLLRDSLWIFSGDDLKMWTDVRDVLRVASDGNMHVDLPVLSMPVDFYPLSILLTKGVVLGIESELLQRRDVNFAQYRSTIRTHLFIPYVLRQQLCDTHDTASAMSLASQYDHLSYFPHALEVLLHHVLDDEVDRQRKAKLANPEPLSGDGPLSTVLAFLESTLPQAKYLSIVVQCIRKTEVTSWRTLFTHLPTPLQLFEQALELEDLKTASGYLIVLQGLDEEDDALDTGKLEEYVVRLLQLARQNGDFELCSELARFMIAIDPRGNALRRVVAASGFERRLKAAEKPTSKSVGLGLSTLTSTGIDSESQAATSGSARDYFSASPNLP